MVMASRTQLCHNARGLILVKSHIEPTQSLVALEIFPSKGSQISGDLREDVQVLEEAKHAMVADEEGTSPC